MAKRTRQTGMTLIETLTASGLLAMAAAGILLPITAAAAAQTDAQRRVVATRFAADVIERCIAGEEFQSPVTAVELGYPESPYKHIKAAIETEEVPVGEEGTEQLILLTVKVSDNNRPMITLKTLIGGGHL